MLHDHWKGGIYDQPFGTLIQVSESTPNENVLTESNFGCLARLMREKQNANEITLESIIMCKSAKREIDELGQEIEVISTVSLGKLTKEE